MDPIDAVRIGWSWIGLDPVEIVAVNPFGNVIVRAVDGRFWRICPEELACTVIASDNEALTALRQNDAFARDWAMEAPAQMAKLRLGALEAGRCYCLKIPGVLGGAYEASNMGIIDLVQLIKFAGDLGQQIQDLPDGTKVRLDIVD